MSNKTQIFIEKATKIHGNEYDYSNVNYIDLNTPVIITCHTHGSFMIKPINHIRMQSCKKCHR